MKMNTPKKVNWSFKHVFWQCIIKIKCLSELWHIAFEFEKMLFRCFVQITKIITIEINFTNNFIFNNYPLSEYIFSIPMGILMNDPYTYTVISQWIMTIVGYSKIKVITPLFYNFMRFQLIITKHSYISLFWRLVIPKWSIRFVILNPKPDPKP